MYTIVKESNIEDTIEDCPRCGYSGVEWTNSRDLELLTSYLQCQGCDLQTFCVDTCAFTMLPNLDYESSVMKYNAWVNTKPTTYFDEEWEVL